jgi:WD40 repeat protein
VEQASPTPDTQAPVEPHPESQPSLTPTTPQVLPSPTEPQAIRVENMGDIAVIAEIPYPQVYPDHLIYYLSASHEGTKLVIRSENWENRQTALVVWDLTRNVQLLAIEDPPEKIGNVFFSPDSKQLWAVRWGAIDQYDLHNGELSASLPLPELTINALAVSPDGRFVIAGNYDSIEEYSTIKRFRLGSLEPLFSEVMAYMISRFHFSPDSRMVAGTSATIGGTVTKIWEVPFGVEVMAFYDYTGGPVFSSDSSLAALAKGNQFSVYTTDNWQLLKSFQNKNLASTNRPVFLFGDDRILAIQETTRVTFNDVNSGKELLALPGQTTLMTFSPALNVIFTNTNLQNIKLWGVLP